MSYTLRFTDPRICTALKSILIFSTAGFGNTLMLEGSKRSCVADKGSPKEYSPVLELSVTPYVPANTGIFGPSCVPTPVGKVVPPQLNVHAPSALNLTSPVVKSPDWSSQRFSLFAFFVICVSRSQLPVGEPV